MREEEEHDEEDEEDEEEEEEEDRPLKKGRAASQSRRVSLRDRGCGRPDRSRHHTDEEEPDPLGLGRRRRYRRTRSRRPRRYRRYRRRRYRRRR